MVQCLVVQNMPKLADNASKLQLLGTVRMEQPS